MTLLRAVVATGISGYHVEQVFALGAAGIEVEGTEIPQALFELDVLLAASCAR
jgi:hypothetical protein